MRAGSSRPLAKVVTGGEQLVNEKLPIPTIPGPMRWFQECRGIGSQPGNNPVTSRLLAAAPGSKE
jgi:hypothetical protein